MLVKNHEIQTKISRGGKRLDIYRKVQSDKEQKPALLPNPLNATQWSAKIGESEQGNMIMGDMVEALSIIYSKGGIDYDSLTDEEKCSGDLN